MSMGIRTSRWSMPIAINTTSITGIGTNFPGMAMNRTPIRIGMKR
jgi:hypothetical protein